MNDQLFDLIDSHSTTWIAPKTRKTSLKNNPLKENDPTPQSNSLLQTETFPPESSVDAGARSQNTQTVSVNSQPKQPTKITKNEPAPTKNHSKPKQKETDRTVTPVEQENGSGGKIITFKGAANYLSNWAPCEFVYAERAFTSVKQGYYYHLLKEHGEHELAEAILKISDVHDIRTIGESVNVSEGWKKKSVEMTQKLMETKFEDPNLCKKLLETHPHELHHNVANRFWGTGPAGNGRNTTGNILMGIRKKLLKQKLNQTPEIAPRTMKPSSASPDVLLVRDSQLKGFLTDRIRGLTFSVEEMHTSQEVAQSVEDKQHVPGTVILHLLTDNLMKKPVSTVVNEIRSLSKNIHRKHGSRVLVSLGLPVDDYNLNKKIKAANLLLKTDENLETIYHMAAFHRNGSPNPYLYKDWRSPNEHGMRRVAVNFKTVLLQ